MALRELHLFAGAGGGILGGLLLSHVPVCAVELEAYPRNVLLQRQRDGLLPWFPVWDDVCTFDGNPWRGRVDVIAGGFPCTDISSAGKGVGIEGKHSGLWSEFARIIGEVRPRFVFIENSPLLVSRGLDVVSSDLHRLGFDAEWGCVSAADCGAPHLRKRAWILAHANQGRPYTRGSESCEQAFQGKPDHASGCGADVADTTGRGLQRGGEALTVHGIAGGVGDGEPARSGAGVDQIPNPDHTGLEEWDGGTRAARSCTPPVFSDWWATEPPVGRLANGIPGRVDQLKALGNAQVPVVACLAWEVLMGRIQEREGVA